MTAVDFVGRELKVGQKVAKTTMRGRSPCLVLKTVSRVEGELVYLNDWHSPVIYNDRLLIVEDAP